VNAAQQGEDALAPGSALTPIPSAASPGEQALLQQAGPTPPVDIRENVNQSALIASKPPGFVSSLMGAGPTGPVTVDAPAETRRLQANPAAAGVFPAVAEFFLGRLADQDRQPNSESHISVGLEQAQA
jgi:hypothetical protein